jgi:hypothetical protein
MPPRNAGQKKEAKNTGASGTPLELATAFLSELRRFHVKMTELIAAV